MTMTSNSSATCVRCPSLEVQVQALQRENDALREQLAQLQRTHNSSSNAQALHSSAPYSDANATPSETYSAMTRAQLQRYGRQMLVKELGIERQLKLQRARVLVIGVGGLGSPVALYLAAMGVGHLGLVDDDRVERSNLHRQVIHDDSTLHELKVVSARQRIAQLNPDVDCAVYPMRLAAANALALVEQYDVVVDASDNVTTRYLANDACAAAHKPLVSGSALGLEGQVTVFALDNVDTPTGCYRCLYPTPQPSAAAMSCAENGVLGVVPGVIGCLQAMETVKVVTGMGEPLVGVQCLYDAYDGQVHRLRLPAMRRADCSACSASARSRAPVRLRTEGVTCSGDAPVSAALAPEHRMSASAFHSFRETSVRSSYVLLDTRARQQFDMVHFPEALHVPFETLAQWQKTEPQTLSQRIQDAAQASESSSDPDAHARQIVVICRRGVDSVTVTHWLASSGAAVVNVDGGYEAYARDVDTTFPMY